MTMKSKPLYHSELFSFIFDLLWETTFLYSCLELFVDTGYVQGTEKMIMRGVFVEACWSRRGEGGGGFPVCRDIFLAVCCCT